MKPLASLSLDLDNLWSYMKVHNDPGWESFPTYLPEAVPKILDLLEGLDLRLTFFLVGQDAARTENAPAMRRIADSPHEVGNHSFAHEPWLHRYRPDQVEEEIARAEEAIQEATGRRPEGFRGPGYSLSETVLQVLSRRGYRFDASTFPTFLGPAARAYYFMTSRLGSRERTERGALFGTLRDGLRPLAPYRWRLPDGSGLIEVPVTVLPAVRVPFHLTYVLYLSTFSTAAARLYFQAALQACRASRVEPSLLLHPLDFLGGDEAPGLAFFPGMNLPGEEKRRRTRQYLEDFRKAFDVLPMGAYVHALETRRDVPVRDPDFPAFRESR
ncbi:MAG TPA: polysaccharide deacetylase family protein [Myxococcota bacterium]|nr:polysaccharide deacetylase family protein [Myxococcota bacterium]HQK51116.1 polysaccharide deacetylase family protein [Myxococcota bacterium]